MGQIKALTIRQFQKSSGFASFGFAASLALVVGAADLKYRWPLLAVSPEERRLQSYLGCHYDNGALYLERTSKFFQQTISHVRPCHPLDCQLALRPAILRLQHHRLLHDRSLLDVPPHQLHRLSLYARLPRTIGLCFQNLNTAFRPWRLRSRHSERFVGKELPRCHQLVLLLAFAQIIANEYFQVSHLAVTVLFPSERLINGVFLGTIVR